MTSPSQSGKVWGILQRKPTFYELTAMVMSLLFLLSAILPTLEGWVYQAFRVIWLIGFLLLFSSDGPITGRNRPFYYSIWVASSMAMFIAIQGGFPFDNITGQVWRMADVAWIVVILRGAYTYHYRDTKEIAKPLF
ncbi:hypothetical protein GO755_40090 [Spirosoma sp. HMF4905]|uniref:Uncharacterized protein n=1 Tax=Spirosoma arboris TaxID=2682092 RepID=A0A7K1SR55_9BACT|nr:hypothetical protein [Spirosoma arboris]MVM36278.1 hypothetical protein [Spirosoma arboris]